MTPEQLVLVTLLLPPVWPPTVTLVLPPVGCVPNPPPLFVEPPLSLLHAVLPN